MRVDAPLRENGTARETEMRGSRGGKTLDRRADGKNGLRELGGQIRNAELRIKFVDEASRDRIIVPFAGRVHARADPGAGAHESDVVDALADDLRGGIDLRLVAREPHGFRDQPLG